ncbi:hypothetical protein [Zunongwangia endophytica]|uniref:Uncharacterized protein n=1 Tax=Zunongwangia endophytica TaxID=1808945 RepID=A0ABV8H575_9FLAO|nr:hypothetical protein [Zunongwangia endophytica]MDN3595289.1 hypothetical protein [Zunongwangia endophytica]
MENILDIFTAVAEAEGLKIGSLEKSIGASKGVLSRAINKGTDVQSKWLFALVEKYPQYDYQQMLKGEFSTHTKTETESEKNLPVPYQGKNDISNLELRKDLHAISQGMIKNFETISEGVFETLKGQQKILGFIKELEAADIASATKNLSEFLAKK